MSYVFEVRGAIGCFNACHSFLYFCICVVVGGGCLHADGPSPHHLPTQHVQIHETTCPGISNFVIHVLIDVNYQAWIVEVDEDTQRAVLTNEDPRHPHALWAGDFVKISVFHDPANPQRLKLVERGHHLGWLDELRTHHRVVKVTLAPPGVASSLLTVESALFDLPFMGGSVWINVPALCKTTKLKQKGVTGAIFFQKRRNIWLSVGNELDLGPLAVRASVPYSKKTQQMAEVTAERCLMFPSISLPVLLASSLRFSHGTSKYKMKKPADRDAFNRLFLGMVYHAGSNCRHRILWDTHVQRAGAHAIGMCPFTMEVQDGKVDLSDLDTLIASLPDKLPRLDTKLIKALMAHDQKPISELLITLIQNQDNKWAAVLFKQLVWSIADKIESRIRTAHTPQEAAVARTIVRSSSDVLLEPGQVKPIYDPDNARHTHRELGAYQDATKLAFHNCNTASFAGPDGSKVSEKMVVDMVVILNCGTKVVAVAAPQVSYGTCVFVRVCVCVCVLSVRVRIFMCVCWSGWVSLSVDLCVCVCLCLKTVGSLCPYCRNNFVASHRCNKLF